MAFPVIAAHHGMPKSAPVEDLRYVVNKDKKDSDMYDAVAAHERSHSDW